MKTITEKQYRQFQDLKRWAKKERVFQSADSVKKLEDDVDLPIKKCVAMFNLLRIPTLFSCCGFDYKGQPYHKRHQYGDPYIIVQENVNTSNWMENDCIKGGWSLKPHIKGYLKLVTEINKNPHWRDKNCIHYAEESVLAISYLERWLQKLSIYFIEEVTVYDTNQNYSKNGIRFWQYPAKTEWVIRKDLLDTY